MYGQRYIVSFATIGILTTVFSSHALAQDFTIGGDARFFAMAGAGLSLPHRGGARLNPASLAFERAPFGYSLPSLGIRTRGQVELKDSNKYKDVGTDDGNLRLLKDFAKENTDLGFNSSLALRFGPVELGAYGLAQSRLIPNATLRAWANDPNSNFDTVPTGSRSDLITLGYTQTTASFGARLPVSLRTVGAAVGNPSPFKMLPDALAVGIRAKVVQGYYSHYKADADILNSTGNQNLDLFKGDRMDGKDYLRKTGVGIDLGVLARSPSDKGLSFAAVINNFIKPSISFDETDEFDKAKNYDPFRTTLSLGAGLEWGQTSVAADIVDIGGAVDSADVRIGAEQRLFKVLAVRGGLSSRNGVSFGIGLGGFGLAISNKQPFEAMQTFRF